MRPLKYILNTTCKGGIFNKYSQKDIFPKENHNIQDFPKYKMGRKKKKIKWVSGKK